MGKHNPFRLPGTAGRIQDRRHVGVDYTMGSRCIADCQSFFPSHDFDSVQRALLPLTAHDDDGEQLRALRKYRSEQFEPLGGSYQDAYAAIP